MSLVSKLPASQILGTVWSALKIRNISILQQTLLLWADGHQSHWEQKLTVVKCVCIVDIIYSLSTSSVFLSIHLSVCLCVCLVPPHVISPSGQPPHQTSLQAVSRCHASIWLCGMSQPFSREGCLTTIRLHPLFATLCLLSSVLVSFFFSPSPPNLPVSVGMIGFSVKWSALSYLWELLLLQLTA